MLIHMYLISVKSCLVDPGMIPYATRDSLYDYYTCGDTITFRCNYGYDMHGRNSTLTCGSDGYFYGTLFYCVQGKIHNIFDELKKFKCTVYRLYLPQLSCEMY